jgi:hypothetical protein
VALLANLPKEAAAQITTAPSADAGKVNDLRDFVRWIVEELEPSVRLPGGAGRYARTVGGAAELYGTSDMACILYTIGKLRPTDAERQEWAEAFQIFQNPETGFLIEKDPTHTPLHNTAFALGAMQLFDLTPKYPVKMGPEYQDPRAFLATLDWKKAVYTESHKGAGMGAIFALSPGLRNTAWFNEYFAACESYFDPHNGLMGQDKPAGGDSDQVGGTFHYSFLYNYFNRRMPFPERRIDSVIGTQQPDGYWRADNHLWLTLDAMYLLTRTVRYCPYRVEDVRKVVRGIMDKAMTEVFSVEGRKASFVGHLQVHLVTAAISMAAEAQQFLGANEIVTDWPLKLVLDRRPFI